MAQVNKIDSNGTGLRFAEELSLKTLPGSPIWYPLEPNTYKDFGGQLKTMARNPINANRQRKKGVITDLDAAGGFNSDLTQENLQTLLQGFFFADMRRKNVDVTVTAVSGAGLYSMANTTGILVGSLVEFSGFTNATNNGLKVVTAVAAGVSITAAPGVVETPPVTATARVVGFRATVAADLKVDAAGTLPALTSTAANFTQMGLIPGEWIFVGGDAVANQFAGATNNGFKRVRTIAATRLEFDKSDAAMVTDATATGKSVDLYFGRVLKNELGTLIKRRTYQLERTLGAPDDAQPTQIQSEYITGAVANELTFNVPTADKINLDLSFIGLDHEQRTGVVGVKSGTRPALVEADAFNTSSDFSRMRIAAAGVVAPTPLFGFVTELAVTIKNNVSAAKAVAVLGGFDVNVGTFEVGGSITAYFGNISAIQSIRSNANITVDMAVVKNNAGFVLDLPLITLGEGRLAVEQDKPITMPVNMDAATAATIDPNLDYTALMVFFDYLPTLADV